MASSHPDLKAEQTYINRAHGYLQTARERAAAAAVAFGVGRGGTEQARFELEAMLDGAMHRLTQLDIGDRSLVFGRIDPRATGERFYIGRVGLWDADSNPIVVDWRAPVAEPFYRATGRQPLGLERRRHFISRGQTVLSIEDEFFVAADHLSHDGDAIDGSGVADDGGLRGPGQLTAAIQAPRTGRLNDIAASIQSEQDEVIRADLPGVLLVQGGPGTGKTVVALHRAAYLLYTHRFPLDSQGVLVIGPNRLFLAYIEQVLPSLGEAGVELAVLSDLLQPPVLVTCLDSEAVSRMKGDIAMVSVLANAVRDRQRPLRRDITVGYGLKKLRISVEQSMQMVTQTRQRARTHNAGRPLLENAFFSALSEAVLDDAEIVREQTHRNVAVREALEWMWPVLTPQHFLNDLFGSKALLRSAAVPHFSRHEVDQLYRPRKQHLSGISWSFQDVALLDEAQVLLGPRPGRDGDDAFPTYGHIVVDEAQDLSPMQLRMVSRRSLNGSMTVVGDIAQATGAWAHDDWDSVLARLPQKRPTRRVELTVGYRIPAPAMALANRVLPHAAPGAVGPSTVRTDGDEPRIINCGPAPDGDSETDSGVQLGVHAEGDSGVQLGVHAEGDSGVQLGVHAEVGSGVQLGVHAEVVSSVHSGLVATLTSVIAEECAAVGEGNVAVTVPESLYHQIREGLTQHDIQFGGPGRTGFNQQVTLVPVRLVKGLEVDAVVVVEPARIVSEERRGVRSLYVALTRATKRVTVVHAEPLPSMLQP